MSGYAQFVGAMILFVPILLTCSYWFVLYSPDSPSRSQRVVGYEGGRDRLRSVHRNGGK